MKIALHIGAHSTDDDRLLKCLLQNSAKLSEEGIVVPEAGRYRPVIRETLQILKGGTASTAMQETILDAVLDEDEATRVVLSHEAFLCVPSRSISAGKLYPMTEAKAPRLRNLFADQEVEFYIALCNPATFVPAIFNRAKEGNFTRFLGGTDPMALRWSDMISRLRKSVPDAPVTVWCNEDTPLIWPEVLRDVSGHDEFTVLDGADDFFAQLMSRSGFARMRSYMDAHPPQNELQRRRIVEAFLDKFALNEEIEQEIDLPGWTDGYVDQLTDVYDDDVATIEDIEGVTLLTP